jgi:DNA polymerase delta subunit 1
VDGRIVVDILRQVITSSQLASFSLIDCVQTLLGQTLEVGLCCACCTRCAALHCQ